MHFGCRCNQDNDNNAWVSLHNVKRRNLCDEHPDNSRVGRRCSIHESIFEEGMANASTPVDARRLFQALSPIQFITGPGDAFFSRFVSSGRGLVEFASTHPESTQGSRPTRQSPTRYTSDRTADRGEHSMPCGVSWRAPRREGSAGP